MLQKIRSVKLCLMAHPDNEPNSEFEDRISDLEEIEKELKLKLETGNNTKPVLCDFTLNYIIKDCKIRLNVLEQRKQTTSTLGRITEMQVFIVHLQQMSLDSMSLDKCYKSGDLCKYDCSGLCKESC